ncbi:SMI1/KNR4 family protein [Neobacillus kokaensis]|uniref:Knr4/Smi1-like domain-containing protein n=1 Tax=Neobacillus kokaensis TaxID=2759023 RepID=A0ABQ3N7Q1_9BACI|nr:SMI1/KNR4 family protein [Neobacillus kokaensis]GHI00067.1 hypothetical protein AM1BK_36090 [Neobacillus kokaensis]
MKIWKDVYSPDIVLDPLTDEDITSAEKFFNIKLPKEYIKLLSIQNGGYLNPTLAPVSFNSHWGEGIVQIEFLFGIKKGKGILETYSLLDEWGVVNKGYIVISGDGHHWIVLNYSSNLKTPTVSYIDSQTGDVQHMFSSFAEMLQSLYGSSANHIDYQNELVDRFSKNPSLEEAKRLTNSNDEDAIYTGFEYWEKTNRDLPELFEVLLQHIQSSKYLSTQELAVRILWQKVITGVIKEKPSIKRIIETIPTSPLEIIQEYKAEIEESYTNLK